MKHSFHCHLAKSFLWYRDWHTRPHHHHAHWSGIIVAAIAIFSFLSGSINIYIEEIKAQTLPELNFSGGSDLDVRGWEQRINLQSVTFNGSEICLNSNDYGLLTGVPAGGGGLISGNFWIIANIN